MKKQTENNMTAFLIKKEGETIKMSEKQVKILYPKELSLYYEPDIKKILLSAK